MYSEFFLTQRILPCHAGAALRNRKSLKNAQHYLLISGIHIGSIMICGGIAYSRVFGLLITKRNFYCVSDFRCQGKSGITEFFTHIHYSLYKPYKPV